MHTILIQHAIPLKMGSPDGYGELPEPARDADATATGIALSAVAGTVAANYQTCHENAEQLRALQAWLKDTATSTKK